MRSIYAGLAASVALTASAWAQDGLARFEAEVSALLDLATAPKLLVVETDHGVFNTRTLSVGDLYRDGWRLAAVTGRNVTFVKGEERRTVDLPERLRVAEAPAAPAVSVTAPARLANSAADAKEAARMRFGSVRGAISAGDVQAVLAMGGSLHDTYEAVREKTRGAPNRPNLPAFMERFGDRSDGSVLVTADVNGMEGIGRQRPDGTIDQMLSFDGSRAIVIGPETMAELNSRGGSFPTGPLRPDEIPENIRLQLLQR